MTLSKLVLPAPEEPMINVACPGMADPEQPFKICNSFVPLPEQPPFLESSWILTENLTSSNVTLAGMSDALMPCSIICSYVSCSTFSFSTTISSSESVKSSTIISFRPVLILLSPPVLSAYGNPCMSGTLSAVAACWLTSLRELAGLRSDMPPKLASPSSASASSLAPTSAFVLAANAASSSALL